MTTILVIDDDDAMRESLTETLEAERFTVLDAATGRQGLSVLANEAVDGIFLDLRMPGLDGLEVFQRIKALPNHPPVVVLTAHATAENTIKAMQLGAFDHLTKPIARADLLSVAHKMTQRKEVAAKDTPSTFAGMVGSSAAIRDVQKLIGRVADGKTTVLITGETGTGKEVVAQAIHRYGNRAAKPFVALNCAAIPSELLESELFGHAKGAFTGAVSERSGAFADAHGGILFLDEIGDMPLAMQGKMLRTLQEETITPVGGKTRPVDVRIVAATHRDLPARVRDGGFREDLLYRLNVVPIHIPPLRERRGDILPLTRHFLSETGSKSMSSHAQDILQAYDWPGNVRQLRNAIARASLLAASSCIEASDLKFLDEEDFAAQSTGSPPATLPAAVEHLEISLIKSALRQSHGNRTEAARLLNIPRQQLYVKLKKYGL